MTVSINLRNVPEGAEVYIDGKKADVSGTVYSADIGQIKETREIKVEVKQGSETLDSATLKINVNTCFFNKIISVIVNFIFNCFKWKRVPVIF